MLAQQPTTIDEYLALISSDVARASLTNLREIIRDEIPQAQECISYRIPTFKSGGFVIGFAAFKNHCSLFPGHTVAQFAEELKGYKISKGTIQFPHDKPPPEGLVRAIVRARINENMAPHSKGYKA